MGCIRKTQTKRNWKAFVHDKETKEKLLKDVKLFLESRDLYQQNGMPFRRGYLFHGKDGSGKMSMALSLAAKLNYRVCSMDLTEKDLTVSCLKQRLRLIPNQCLVLIENLDALSSSQKGNKKIWIAQEKRILKDQKIEFLQLRFEQLSIYQLFLISEQNDTSLSRFAVAAQPPKHCIQV